ncbi:Rad52/Rad22 family DNA repair protein [Synechocystis sp. FACHB-383]|uniref:Rad52/Rad22 family DNA repair protein n=1 Tax=Synechocystis sp. FACHB-383 TaxID=2692864 RepID=UPI001F553AFB|nr:Rad52/Rad22 family DNA repair protein [Synechocystis sp. FACHB-383]
MLLNEILENLRQPIAPQFISQKKTYKNKKPTGSVDFVAWYDLADLLDDLCGLGGWEWLIIDTQQIGDRLTLTGSLTIHGDDRSLTRQATGTEDIDCSSYGDPSSNAEAMALRRCCAKFGLGRDLWRREKPQPLKMGQRREPEKQTVFPRHHLAGGMA